MSFRFYPPEVKQLKSSLNLMDYVANLQQHMTFPRVKQELNYQSQVRLELLASRQSFS